MNDFELLLLAGTNPSGVAMARDILAAAALFATRRGESAPTWGMYSVDGGRIELQGGIGVETSRLPRRRRGRRSILLVPGLWVADAAELRRRLDRDDSRRAIRLIASHVALGGQVAATCSAVFLLEAGGLLRGRRATTAWWLAPELARRATDVMIEAQRILCVDGPVLTAGAAFALTDALLHLLRVRFGATLADGVSRVLLLADRGEQAQYVLPSMLASGDALVTRLTQRIESALPDPPSVARLAKEFQVSERTLSRHVRGATGMRATALIRSVRLHRARSLLQNSRMSVEEVAAAVGYRDTTALRRLIREAAGTTPGGMRSSARVATTPAKSTAPASSRRRRT